MTATLIVKFVNADGSPHIPNNNYGNQVALSIQGGPEFPNFVDENKTGTIEIPLSPGQENQIVRVYSHDKYDDSGIKSSPEYVVVVSKDGKTVTFNKLREGESPNIPPPVSFVGGLLIGTAAAAGIFALNKLVIQPHLKGKS
jgi:hypothetical protein